MIAISFILPAVVVLVLFCTTLNYDLWCAYLLMLACSELILWLLFRHVKKQTDKEFVSGYAVSTEHYNAWVEQVRRTRTEYDSKGNAHTVTYYEYVTHPEHWQRHFNIGRTEEIAKWQFDELCQLFGTSIDYFATYHPNCVSGGGGHRCLWDQEEWHTITRTFKQGYYNPIKYSNSIFKFTKITEADIQTYQLFDYPPIAEDQMVVCYQPGLERFFKEEAASPQEDPQVLFQHINAFFGKEKQIHVFVLVFDAQKYGADVAEMQRSLWQGGNKNELVVCIGVDGETVRWSHVFSWMDDITLHTLIQDYFLQNTEFDLVAFAQWLPEHLDKWKRKEFKDFAYLGTNLSPGAKAGLIITSAVMSAACIFATLYWIAGAAI